MKKLMIAAAIVCAAVVSQASQFAWGFTSDEITTHLGGENYLEGGTALLYLGTVSYSAGSGWDLTGATLLGTAAQDSNTYKFGPFTPAASNPSSALVNADGGQAYTLILTEASDVAGINGYEGYYYLENGISGAGSYMSGTDSIKVATMRSTKAVGGADWLQASAVPEPTSGLLLLLGVAGLALKRKRA